MNSRERFIETMRYGNPDRVPYFREGVRPDVLKAWRAQGLPQESDLWARFASDRREEVVLDLRPHPEPRTWPTGMEELDDLRSRLDPHDDSRLPEGWPQSAGAWRQRDHPLMLRVHRGFFQSLGIGDWRRFTQVLELTKDDPEFVRVAMQIQGRFAASLADRFLDQVRVDAAIFSEPIGGNHGPLISPKMYRELALPGYEPLLETLKRHEVEVIIIRTYANARVLIPSLLEWGFNCLWACECSSRAMDYRGLRREFGVDLRLIGGIDLDVLRKSKGAIRREVMSKALPLIAQGGYAPLADGRVRANIPLENYLYYRKLLQSIG
jgi:hypothetical protein